MGEINYTNGLIMGALFSIFIIIFAAGFANDNESSINAGSDTTLTKTSTSQQDEISNFKDAVTSSSDTFNKDNVKESTDTATSGGQFKVTAGSALSTAKNSINLGFKKIFGEDSGFGFVLVALISIIVLTFVRYAYKTWFGKDPD